MPCDLESLTDSLSGKTQQKEKAMFSFTSLTASLAQGNGPSISSILILVLGLMVAVVALAIIAPGLHIPYSILLVLGGLLLGFVPGLPRFTLDSDVVFLLLLPPLLSASAWQTSSRDFHANLRPISLLPLGLVAGWCISYVHRWLDNPPLEITVTLVTPYAVYLLGEEVLHVSGVLATVTTGLYLTWRAPTFFSSGTRLQAEAVWEMLIFLLNGLVFILIGLQLPGILATLNTTIARRSPILLVWDAALVSLTVILVRLVWAFTQALLPRLLSRRLRERDPYPGWRPVALI